jgi:hypothetical protein
MLECLDQITIHIHLEDFMKANESKDALESDGEIDQMSVNTSVLHSIFH